MREGGEIEAGREGGGASRGMEEEREYEVEVSSIVRGGRMRIWMAYSGERMERERMEEMMKEYEGSLRRMIEHCVSEEAGGYTPSDFPEVKVGQEVLDRMYREGGRIEDMYRLTPMQEGMLFHSVYGGGGGEYVVQMVSRVEGDVEVDRLERAWEEVIRRNEVLRTEFEWEGVEEAVQVVREEVRMKIEYEDWRGEEREQQEKRLEEELKEERRRGIELGKGPLMRMRVRRMGEREYEMVWSFHHILLDGWSTPEVIKEVLRIYEEEGKGEVREEEKRRKYREYVKWVRGQSEEEEEKYWREKLRGRKEGGRIGIERKQRSGEEEEEKEERQYEEEVGEEETRRLEEIGRENDVTMSTMVQGAWGIVISRYMGEKEVMYGVTVSGRGGGMEGIEKMVGMCINTVAVREEVEEEEEVMRWMKKKQEGMMEMMEYEHSALVKVGGWSEIGRGERMFESIVVYENYPVDKEIKEWKGSLSFKKVTTKEKTGYPLLLVVLPQKRLTLRLVYDSALIDINTVKRMAGHLKRLLESIAENPHQKILELQLLTKAEEQWIAANHTYVPREYPSQECIHKLIERQVDLTPDAAAVTCGDAHLTYSELNARANQLARFLADRSIGRGQLVGLYLDHSIETLVAIMGVLKSGAAYLPLDPGYPKARVRFIAGDSSLRLMLTQERHSEKLSEIDCEKFCVDSQWEEVSQYSSQNLPGSEQGSEELAYVIYTSGSTGEPKGVMITHRNLINYIWWAKSEYLESGEEEAFALYSSLAFDLTVTSIYVPLMSGNRVIVIAGEEKRVAVIEAISDQRVRIVKLTPSHLRMIAGMDNSGSTVRKLIVGGEELDSRLCREVEASFGRKIAIYNEYGPTEATVGSMIKKYDSDKDTRERVSIGRPIANTQIIIADARQRLVPIGIPGELMIGGDGLASGYHRHSSLTAEKFIPSMDGKIPGARLYRSGDLARYLEDGNIEFLGRKDDQVKIRGYRIELLEIENALRRSDSVQEALVIMREYEAGNKQLIAYVVPKAEVAITEIELKSFLSGELPDYMLPATYIILDALPLTENGKIDRDALPEPANSMKQSRTEYHAPSTEIEQMVAGLWQEVLKQERVGIDDNFFDLGGHSLLMLRIHSKMQEALRQKIALVSLFEYPTVRRLAEFLTEGVKDNLSSMEDEEVLRKGRGRLAHRLKQAQQDWEKAEEIR
jgi:amino acid adenylation domain-containing protein